MSESEQTKTKVFCPLFNFQISEVEDEGDDTNAIRVQVVEELNSFVEGFEFIDVTKIRRIKDQELEKMKVKHEIDYNVAGAFYNSYEGLFVVEFPRDLKEKLVPFVENVLLALRLYKEGDVFCKVIFSESGLSFTFLNPTYEMPNPLHRTIYSIKMEEIGKIREIFDKITKADFDRRRYLRIACDRFNRSYGRSMHDEKIIDFMIAFEALFLREEKASSQGQTIGVGGSMLLGKNDLERKQIYDFLIETYKLRNKIVHGSAITYSGIDETASKLKGYLRKSITALL
jgi:hypothetical protein